MKEKSIQWQVADELEEFYDNLNCHCTNQECCGLPANECKLKRIDQLIIKVKAKTELVPP